MILTGTVYARFILVSVSNFVKKYVWVIKSIIYYESGYPTLSHLRSEAC